MTMDEKNTINNIRFVLFALLILSAAIFISANVYYFVSKKSDADIVSKPVEPGKGLETNPDDDTKEGAEQAQVGGGEADELPGVKVYKASIAPFVDVLHCSGHVVGSSTTELRFEINGIVRKFNFKEGDLIKAGDVVAELDSYDSELKVKFREAKLKAAQTSLLSTKKKLQMHQDLYKIGAIIKAKLEEVQFEYQNSTQEYNSAKIELASAKSELAKTKLISPKNAVLETRDVETGEFVTSNTKVSSLVDIETIFVDFGIIEKQIDRIAVGQDIIVKVDSYPDKTFNGKIERIFPTIDPRTGMLTVRGKVKNVDNLLLPGMFAVVDVVVYSKPEALLVPRDAVSLGDDNTYSTMIVDEEDKVASIKVVIEYDKNPDFAVVAKGLDKGTKVIQAESQYGLKPGMKVEIIEEKEGT